MEIKVIEQSKEHQKKIKNENENENKWFTEKTCLYIALYQFYKTHCIYIKSFSIIIIYLFFFFFDFKFNPLIC